MADIQDTIGTKEQNVLIDRIAEALAVLSKEKKLITAGQARLALMATLQEGMSMKKASELDAEARKQIFLTALMKGIENLNLDPNTATPVLMDVYVKWKAEFGK